MRYHILTSELIKRSGRKARQFGHSYVGSAHLLAAMAELPGGTGQFLRSLGLDQQLTEVMTQLFYGVGKPDLPLPQGLTTNAGRILRTAAREARHLNSRQVKPVHVLLAMSRLEDCSAAELLALNGISRDMLFTQTVEYLQWENDVFPKFKKEAVATKLLEQFSEDLIQKVSQMEPIVGREREIDMVVSILCRKNKNNPATDPYRGRRTQPVQRSRAARAMENTLSG